MQNKRHYSIIPVVRMQPEFNFTAAFKKREIIAINKLPFVTYSFVKYNFYYTNKSVIVVFFDNVSLTQFYN